ncbi:cytochrome P450 [Xylaria castorea]|nr:cytochrome P450 [Xylaria castorea]
MSNVFLSEAHGFVCASVGIATATFFCVAIFNLFFHPLAYIPGPTAAAIADFWLLWQLFSLRKCESLHECLLKYGSVVRVGPNKLVVSGQDDIKTIYGPGSKCLKSSFYPAWNLNGASNIFSNVDPKDHSFRRSLTARTFSKQTTMRFMPQLIKHARELADRLEILSKGTEHGHSNTVEFIKLARYLALDMLGTSVLDEEFGLLKKGINHPFVDDLDAASLVIPARATLPTWVWFVVKRLPIPRLQHLLGGEGRLAKYAAKTIERYNSKSDGGENKSLSLVSCYSNYRDHEGNRLSTDHFIGEISAAYFAGTDTISVSLSFAVYEIASRADVQERLRTELVEKAGSGGRLTYEVLEKDCAYLSAVISEVLRLYAALPSHLERVVPPGGMTLSTGHHIPAGTVVGTQPFSLHRDATLFPDPSRFDPDRWLYATPEMRKSLCPWGFGNRICMGMHLAYIEFRLALAVLVGSFNLTLPPDYDHEVMCMKNFWFVFPQGGKVNVLVAKRSAGESVTIC